MAEVKIRQLPDWVIEAHRGQAAHEGTSLEQHLRALLTDTATHQKHLALKNARRLRERLQRELGGMLSERSADLVREVRDERG